MAALLTAVSSKGAGGLAADDTQSLADCFLVQREALARFCRARLGADAEVDDLLQDLWVKVDQLPPDAEVREPRAYLYRLASNLMADRWRSSRRAAARDAAWRDAAQGAGDADDRPSPEVEVIARQRMARLRAEVERLPDKTRTIFIRHKFDGLSYAEVASEAGLSKSAVEKHMMAALRRLARAVDR